MKLERMLEDRHTMSQTVREEVSQQSQEWGYKTGSVYIRKVHFRDDGMISQIEQKVVNRLRQVTAAIQQDGANRVNVIRSAAEREAAVEFAKAAAMRPQIVGSALSAVAARQGALRRALRRARDAEPDAEPEADRHVDAEVRAAARRAGGFARAARPEVSAPVGRAAARAVLEDHLDRREASDIGVVSESTVTL